MHENKLNELLLEIEKQEEGLKQRDLLSYSNGLIFKIRLCLKLNKFDQAQQELNKYAAIQEVNPSLQHEYQYLQGFMLVQHGRLKDKAKAQALFEDLLTQSTVGFEIKMQARLGLITLFLQEYQVSPHPMILKDIDHQLKLIKEQAIKARAFYFLGKVQVIQSKKALMDGDVKASLQILEEIEHMANEKQMPLLLDEIHTEKRNLTDQYNQMEIFLHSDPTTTEKLNRINLHDYLKSAMDSISSLQNDQG